MAQYSFGKYALMLKTRLFIILLFTSITFCCRGEFIRINNQNDFDNIDLCLKEKIQLFNVIEIVLKNGEYFFSDNHIYLNNLDRPNCSISIRGNGSKLIAKGVKYNNGGLYNKELSTAYGFLRDDLSCYSQWSDFYELNEPIEIVDLQTKECRFKTHLVDNLEASTKRSSYLQITKWYSSSVYNVTRISGGYIYFYANDLKEFRNGYNINADVIIGGRMPRFRLSNVEIKECPIQIREGRIFFNSSRTIYECQSGTFIKIENCKLGKFSIKGLSIIGGRTSRPSVAIDSSFFEKLLVKSCSFIGNKSISIAIHSSSNVTVTNCYFKDGNNGSIFSDNGSCNTQINKCNFERTDLSHKNDFTIKCQGTNYIISQNTIKDFGYGGIAVGVWIGQSMDNPSTGLIENNELYYTSDFLFRNLHSGLIDGGAIYVYTHNYSVKIKGNIIHDIAGGGNNRGIYCDDGARNVIIKENLIYNILTGFCIDSRNVYGDVSVTNCNNVMSNNIISGDYRFEGNDAIDKNNCIKGQNVVLVSGRSKVLVNNILNQTDDFYSSPVTITSERIRVDKDTFRFIRKRIRDGYILSRIEKCVL